jgi:hypothetical protein
MLDNLPGLKLRLVFPPNLVSLSQTVMQATNGGQQITKI